MTTKVQSPKTKVPRPIDWPNVSRVLVVRLRSIGDSVLATPSLIALRRFLPDAEIDILLEDWVAPVLDGFEGVNVISVGTSNAAKLKAANHLRSHKYDVAYNLHGGTTSSMFVRASGAKHRVGLSHYRYKRFYNHLYTSAADFWHQPKLHSAEQQLALLGFTGVPVDYRPKSKLVVTKSAIESLKRKFHAKSKRRQSIDLGTFALLHPSTAFFTKQWPTANFARTAEYLDSRGIATVAIASKAESAVLDELTRESSVPITTFDDLTLPEITALASQARVFVGNDSGMAHIAAAVGTPSVVIFGSSNRDHWHPWTDAAYEVVYEPFECQPCPGYECAVYGMPRCILEIPVARVNAAIAKVLK